MELPWNNETEQRLLSILISSSSAAILDKLIIEHHLKEDDFFGNWNRTIYSAIVSLIEDGKPVDVATLAHKLNLLPNNEMVEYIKKITLIMGISSSAGYYAQMLKDLTKRRQYLIAAQNIQKYAYDVSRPIDSIMAELEAIADSEAEGNTLKSAKDLYVEAYSDIVELYSRKGDIPGKRTPWSKLDRVTGGLGKGELIFIGARPGMGKSIMGQNIAEHIAFHEREIAILFTLEMPCEQIMKRIMSAQAGVHINSVKTGKLEATDFQDLGLIANMDELKNLLIDDNTGIDIEYIKSVCRMVKRKHKEIGVVVIDYLQLMQMPSRATNKVEGISEITRKLKILAKELDCPIVVLSQLNRKNEREQDKHPKLSDLRDSGSIEQDADKVFLLYREAYYRDSAPARNIDVIVAKSRDGQTGTIQMSWQPQIMRIMNPNEVEWLKKEAEERRKKLSGEQIGINNQGGIAQ